MADRTGARLKLERAKKHIFDFEVQARTFLDSEPYKIGAKLRSDINHYMLYIGSIEPLPETLSLIVGDAVHNLRSALDHIAWQLVLAAGGTPNKHTYFPICEAPQQYRSAIGQGEINKLNIGAKETLRLVQPYESGNDSLLHLHQLDIADKHRLVIAVNSVVSVWGLKRESIWLGSVGFGEKAETGDDLFYIPVDTYDKSHKNLKIGFEITFGKSEILAGEPVLIILQAMADVVDNIIRNFERFLV
jgi:hypothetical protein